MEIETLQCAKVADTYCFQRGDRFLNHSKHHTLHSEGVYQIAFYAWIENHHYKPSG